MIFLLIIVAFAFPVKAQRESGYVPFTEPAQSNLLGIWVNESIDTHVGTRGHTLWQRVEILSDGEMIHDYYFSDPSLTKSLPIERLFSRWSAGYYFDPNPALGNYLVMRIVPYESHSLKEESNTYQILKSEFLPVYRRFSIFSQKSSLALSEPFLLVVPFVNQLRSFPSDANYLDYDKIDTHTTTIRAATWGVAKTTNTIPAHRENRGDQPLTE